MPIFAQPPTPKITETEQNMQKELPDRNTRESPGDEARSAGNQKLVLTARRYISALLTMRSGRPNPTTGRQRDITANSPY